MPFNQRHTECAYYLPKNSTALQHYALDLTRTMTRIALMPSGGKDGCMRYAVVILLMASPAFAGEPVYSWRSQADDSDRIYLYLDGNQIGGWCYSAKYYRPFDGKNWGSPINTAPVRPPDQRVVVIPQQRPIVITPQSPALPPLRGPLRNKLATAMAQTITDMTMKMIEEIPGAIVDSLKKGNYKLDFQYSVTPPPQQPITPPPQQPEGRPRRWFR